MSTLPPKICMMDIQPTDIEAVIDLQNQARLSFFSLHQMDALLLDDSMIFKLVKLAADNETESVKRGKGAVIGYCSGRVILDVFEIDNLLIEKDYRQQGIGRKLLLVTLETAWAKGSKLSYLEVRSSNLAAYKLYQSLGFQQIGIRRGYYSNPPEDALILKLDDASYRQFLLAD